MNSIPNEFPISLQSWPSQDTDPNSALPSLIQRINFERGGFRDLSEDGLRQEIAEAEAEEGDTSSDEEEEEKPDRSKELMTARDEMLQNLEQAHQGAMFALDFISLLLSKDQPNQAGATLSPFLRETVGMGTLGADKITESKVTNEQKKDNENIAKGWKLQNLNKSVDLILASATRLEKEIEVETKYWEQVLAVSNNGWAICRLPQEKHTLGVRFGFSEAAPAFKNRSLAALRREPDGNISLDQGIASTEPQALRVRIRNNNEETGSSPIPSAIPDDSPVQSHILQARNTTFSSELWQELNREARTLAAFDIHSKEDTIICPISPSKTMILDLVSLGDANVTPGPDDKIAEGISLALSLLLSYQHRQNYRRRTLSPPPLSTQKRQTPPYNLLRPLITRLEHQRTLTSVQILLKPLCGVLKSAGLTPSYTISSKQTPPLSTSLSITELTIKSMTDHLESITTFNIAESIIIVITSRTQMFPVAGTLYHVSLQPENCPLIQTCKAPPSLDSWRKVEDYVLFATGCALASSFSYPISSLDVVEKGNEGWQSTIQPYILRKHFRAVGKSKQLSFQVAKGGSEDLLRVRVRWEWIGDAAGGGARERKALDGEGSYEWVGKKIGEWDDEGGEVFRGLTEIVEEAGKA